MFGRKKKEKTSPTGVAWEYDLGEVDPLDMGGTALVLDHMGGNGWELVGILTRSKGQPLAVFKRRKT